MLYPGRSWANPYAVPPREVGVTAYLLMARTRRSDPSSDGFTRRRSGNGFRYLKPTGAAVSVEDRARIDALAIPPAWRHVWICPDPMGHVQATGRDDAGRTQYIYHEAWWAHRDRLKHEEMLNFARVLPKVRRRAHADLRTRGFNRDRVLAAAIVLLDRGLFRIGNEAHTQSNGSYGLTTIQRRHVTVEGDLLRFAYRAKAGVRQMHEIEDRDLAALISKLRRRQGSPADLLMYKERGRWADVRADAVNEHLRDLAGIDCSAKDFRTWNATVLAAVELANRGLPDASRARERVIRQTVCAVADELGNTPSVCRTSYIDPRVFDIYRNGQVIAPASQLESHAARRRAELSVLRGLS